MRSPTPASPLLSFSTTETGKLLSLPPTRRLANPRNGPGNGRQAVVDGATKTSTEPLTEVGDSVNSEPPAEWSRNLETAERSS